MHRLIIAIISLSSAQLNGTDTVNLYQFMMKMNDRDEYPWTQLVLSPFDIMRNGLQH